MPTILGVEIEFHVEDDPNPGVTYETRYPVVVSHTRNAPQGNVHRRHGNLVREISRLTDDMIRVSYDLTASFGDTHWEGYELSSVPMDLLGTLEAWKLFFDSTSKQYLNPDPDVARRRYAPAHHSCGMHIHLSGDDLTLECIEGVSEFINSRTNEEFVTYIAGRYNTQFCRIVPRDADFIKCLFHSEECRKQGKIDRSEVPKDQWNYCCPNANQLAIYIHDVEISRHTAVNHLPNANTGAIELRLFSSPNNFDRMAANVQFAQALVEYCGSHNLDEMDVRLFCNWLQDDRPRRRQYKYLFRYLREAAFVKGLIPRQ